MVRHCVVPGCGNSDLTTLCHRFPKRKDAFDQWKLSLQLGPIHTDHLLQRYVVCTLHFSASDYRNTNSRMLNSVAVPKLEFFHKTAFYDAPTMTIGAASSNATADYKNKSVKGEVIEEQISVPESVVEVQTEREDEQDEVQEQSTMLLIEPVETLGMGMENDDDMVFYMEEEISLSDSVEATPVDATQPQEESPVPEAKRLRTDSSNEEILVDEPLENVQAIPIVENVPSRTTYHHATAQTDEVQIMSSEEQMQRRMVEEFYPEYADRSRLDLIKELREKDERLLELTKKLTNFETAHAAMMKTMEAFKSIMN